MNILYGVAGEGLGHATRARVFLEHLSQRHKVTVLASGRAVGVLQSDRWRVIPIWGLEISYRKQGVHWASTVVKNVRSAVTGIPSNLRVATKMAESFSPDVVVSDFESMSWAIAQTLGLPFVSLDNIQFLSHGVYPKSFSTGQAQSLMVARCVVQAKIPSARARLIPSFVRGTTVDESTTLIPAVVRKAVETSVPERGNHLLVYQTSEKQPLVLEALELLGIPARVYGWSKTQQGRVRFGNITLCPYDPNAFVEDLRTARAVVTNGGFGVLSEALYLEKPILSVPIRGQFEQHLNACQLEATGMGARAERFSRASLTAFLDLEESHRAAVRERKWVDNRRALSALDRALERLTLRE